MDAVTVVIDARGATAADLATAAASLLGEVATVQVVRAHEAALSLLIEEFGSRVRADRVVFDGRQVLVTSALVGYSRGSLDRLVQRARTQGRLVTRVLVPKRSPVEGAALWDGDFLRAADATVDDLLDGGLDFDRACLPHDSGTARAWIPADELGLEPTCDIGPDAMGWARRTGRALSRRRHWYAAVRSRAGAARRRRALRRLRRGHRLRG